MHRSIHPSIRQSKQCSWFWLLKMSKHFFRVSSLSLPVLLSHHEKSVDWSSLAAVLQSSLVDCSAYVQHPCDRFLPVRLLSADWLCQDIIPLPTVLNESVRLFTLWSILISPVVCFKCSHCTIQRIWKNLSIFENLIFTRITRVSICQQISSTTTTFITLRILPSLQSKAKLLSSYLDDVIRKLSPLFLIAKYDRDFFDISSIGNTDFHLSVPQSFWRLLLSVACLEMGYLLSEIITSVLHHYYSSLSIPSTIHPNANQFVKRIPPHLWVESNEDRV